jgi:hypothetical protein
MLMSEWNRCWGREIWRGLIDFLLHLRFPNITFIDLNPGFVGTELHKVGREQVNL